MADEVDNSVESDTGTSYLDEILQGAQLENETKTIVWKGEDGGHVGTVLDQKIWSVLKFRNAKKNEKI